ncbi:MAG TPA: DHA2 family efflux MFS transporter permease subunit [Castellaniella sp.]|uniref:DHA2 family efflux MFS transporter permease subunit n=1 Tax=Castellaniella sp. TaxID=1955812 RepID=UPI002F224819
MTEPDPPAWVLDRPDAHWLAVYTVCIGAFMGQLDASIVTVAFPTLQQHFGAPMGEVEWVALSYLLVLVAAVVAAGRFSDMVGRKLLYTYGFALFTLASVACGFAPNLPSLIVFRAIQGLGAVMLQANSVALIATSIPRATLGRAIGIQGAFQALGLALGPSVGGLLIALGGWRLIFFVNLPAGILGCVAGWYLLPRSRYLAKRAPFDWWGLALFAPASVALFGALSRARETGFDSTPVVGMFALAILFLIAFLLRETRAHAPMVDLRLFRNAAFSAGIASGLLSYAVLFGILFVVPFLTERGFGLSTGTSGLVLTVLPAALGITAPYAGRLADRVGARPLTVAGMTLSGLGLLMAAFWHGGPAALAVELVIMGIGLGLFTPPNNAAIMASAPQTQSGSAGGLLNMTRSIGTALGVALAALVFGFASGSDHPAHALTMQGFAATAVLLAVLALLAAGLAALRGGKASA